MSGVAIPAELRRLSDAATPGPWSWEQCGEQHDDPVVGIAFAGDDPECEAPYEGEFRDEDAYRAMIAGGWQSCDGYPPSANAALAVAAVNFVRSLLAAAPQPPAPASAEAMREAAAKVAEDRAGRLNDWGNPYYKAAAIAMARDVAAAIRALPVEQAGRGEVEHLRAVIHNDAIMFAAIETRMRECWIGTGRLSEDGSASNDFRVWMNEAHNRQRDLKEALGQNPFVPLAARRLSDGEEG